MLRRLRDMFFGVSEYSSDLEAIDWKPIVTSIKDHIENHSIYLELKEGGWCQLESANDLLSITGVAVAYTHEDIEAWDTKVPAKYMAVKLSDLLGKELPVMLSRDYRHFVGYYVYVRT